MKFAEVREHNLLRAAGGFSCIAEGEVLLVYRDDLGLFVQCDEGGHYLASHKDEEGNLVGFEQVQK